MDLSLTSEVSRLVQESRLDKPCIRISLEYKPPVCTSSFCRKRPYISVNIVDERSIQEGFARVASYEGIPIHIANPLMELANREGKPIKIEVSGAWKFRKLVLKGLDPYKL